MSGVTIVGAVLGLLGAVFAVGTRRDSTALYAVGAACGGTALVLWSWGWTPQALLLVVTQVALIALARKASSRGESLGEGVALKRFHPALVVVGLLAVALVVLIAWGGGLPEIEARPGRPSVSTVSERLFKEGRTGLMGGVLAMLALWLGRERAS